MVLTSSRDHETGHARRNWAAADLHADYPVHRLKCIRPFLRPAYPRSALFYRLHEAVTAAKLAAAMSFFALRYRVRAICIADDETVGWTALLSKCLLFRRTLIYCHGDDLLCGKEIAPQRRRWFGVADAIVAANRHSMNFALQI